MLRARPIRARAGYEHMRSVILGLALLVAGVAMAQQGYVGIEQRLTPAQLQEIGLTPKQVELLDRYLGAATGNAPPVETARYETPQGQAKGDPTSFLGFSDQPIKSRLKGSLSGWEPGTVFELENGQQWKVLKGSMKLRKPYERTEVLVVPGIAGRWFLQVDEDLPKARVYRID